MDDVTDQELLVRARTEAAAFGVFYRRHVRGVHGYFSRRVQPAEAAFDLTAETFAAALAAVPRYQPRPAPAAAWLYAIARNTLAAALRAGRVEDRARRALQMQPIELDAHDIVLLEAEPTPALEALAALPDDQRAAIEARHLDGSSYEDIAARLRCSESVVRQRVSRGLRTLQARIEEATHG
jgi:RNA polymerase sigma-70 factor (ECF subfamily)